MVGFGLRFGRKIAEFLIGVIEKGVFVKRSNSIETGTADSINENSDPMDVRVVLWLLGVAFRFWIRTRASSGSRTRGKLNRVINHVPKVTHRRGGPSWRGGQKRLFKTTGHQSVVITYYRLLFDKNLHDRLYKNHWNWSTKIFAAYWHE